nr:hypothetical protein [Pantoea sp. IMH]
MSSDRPAMHSGVCDGWDHIAVIAQHRLLQAISNSYRLLAHNE